MELTLEGILPILEASGWLAPVLFILLHIFRQVFFIPVMVICLAGGYLFGVFYGTIYSIIGLTAISIVFYFIIHAFPTWLAKLSLLKEKFFGYRENLNLMQIMILRVLPFIHFHLISLYLIEITNSFKEYCKFSVMACIPPALLYTVFGDLMRGLPVTVSLFLLLLLVVVFYTVGKKPFQLKAFHEKLTANQKV